MSKFSSRGSRRPKISSRGNFQKLNFLPGELSKQDNYWIHRFSLMEIIEGLECLQAETSNYKNHIFFKWELSSREIIEILNFLQRKTSRNYIFFKGKLPGTKYRNPKFSSRGNFQEHNFLPGELSRAWKPPIMGKVFEPEHQCPVSSSTRGDI